MPASQVVKFPKINSIKLTPYCKTSNQSLTHHHHKLKFHKNKTSPNLKSSSKHQNNLNFSNLKHTLRSCIILRKLPLSVGTQLLKKTEKDSSNKTKANRATRMFLTIHNPRKYFSWYAKSELYRHSVNS